MEINSKPLTTIALQTCVWKTSRRVGNKIPYPCACFVFAAAELRSFEVLRFLCAKKLRERRESGDLKANAR